MIDLNEMLIFAKVVETGSFIGAARTLGIPKSTVSRKVAELEDRLGTRLLIRTTRKVQPTEVGRTYFEQAIRITADAEAADRAVHEAQDVPTGRLRVTTTMVFAQRHLAPLLGEFRKAYPRVDVEILAVDRMVDLVGERFDLAIRAGRMEDSGLIARRVGSGNTILAASPEYLRQAGTPARIEDLRGHDCLLLGSGPTGQGWYLEGPDGPTTLSVTGPLIANDVEILRQAALVGLGIARLPVFMIGEDLAEGRLVEVLPGASPSNLGVYLVYPGGRQLSAKVRVFIDFFVEHARLSPWLQSPGVVARPRG